MQKRCLPSGLGCSLLISVREVSPLCTFNSPGVPGCTADFSDLAFSLDGSLKMHFGNITTQKKLSSFDYHWPRDQHF